MPLQQGYTRVNIAMPKPLAEAMRRRAAEVGPRAMKLFGTAAAGVIIALPDAALEALLEWAHSVEIRPHKADPALALAAMLEGLSSAQEASGAPRLAVTRTIDPEIALPKGQKPSEKHGEKRKGT